MLKDKKSAAGLAVDVALRNEVGIFIFFAGLLWRYRVAFFALIIAILFMT